MADFGISTVLFWTIGFAVMFCGTAGTILSGAVAERMKFGGYLLLAVLVAGFTYPTFGHWAWNGLDSGSFCGLSGSRSNHRVNTGYTDTKCKADIPVLFNTSSCSKPNQNSSLVDYWYASIEKMMAGTNGSFGVGRIASAPTPAADSP